VTHGLTVFSDAAALLPAPGTPLLFAAKIKPEKAKACGGLTHFFDKPVSSLVQFQPEDCFCQRFNHFQDVDKPV